MRLGAVVMAVLSAGWALPGHAGATTPEAAARAVLAYDRPATFGVNLSADQLVKMRDGFSLTCDLRRPASADGAPAVGRFPSLVIDFTAYGRKQAEFVRNADWFTARGYNTILCNTRGTHGSFYASPAPNSVGMVDPWGPQEQEDNYDLVEWLAGQTWSNGRVGQTGFSYGAISTLMVAGRQVPPSLKAIVPIAGVTDVYRQLIYPGGVRAGAGPNASARGRFSVACAAACGDPTAAARLESDWRGHPTFDDYWARRAFDPAGIQAATLYVVGARDFASTSIDPLNDALSSRSDYALVLGPWEHSRPEDHPVEALPRGVYLAWYDRWLAQDFGAPRFPKAMAYEAPEATGPWIGLGAWPPVSARSTRFYPGDGGALETSPAGSTAVSYDATTGSATFDTAPLARDTVLAGPPRVALRAAFPAQDGIVITAVLDVAPDGTVTDLAPPAMLSNGRAYLRASHRTSDSSPEPVEPEKAYDLRLRIPSKFWRFRAGHRIRLLILSQDGSLAPEDTPTGSVAISIGEGTYVDLPLADPARSGPKGLAREVGSTSPARPCRRTLRLPRGSRRVRVLVAGRRVSARRRGRTIRFALPATTGTRTRVRVRVDVRLTGGRRKVIVRTLRGCR